jgi:hypothetical protein
MQHLDIWFCKQIAMPDYLPGLFVLYKDYEPRGTKIDYLALHMLLMLKPLFLLNDMMRQWLVLLCLNLGLANI